MSSLRGGGGYPSRDGLFSRPQGDQAQVSIDMGSSFDVDEEVDDLRGQVGMLKSLARAIGNEHRENEKVAESLEEVMDNTKLAMKRGMRRLNKAFTQSKSNHLLYLFLFAFGFFFVIIFWTRVANFLKVF